MEVKVWTKQQVDQYLHNFDSPFFIIVLTYRGGEKFWDGSGYTTNTAFQRDKIKEQYQKAIDYFKVTLDNIEEGRLDIIALPVALPKRIY